MNFRRSEGTGWKGNSHGKKWKTGLQEGPELEKSHGQECSNLPLSRFFARLPTGEKFLTASFQAVISGNKSMRRICAAMPNCEPDSSTRTTVARQQTQQRSPEVSSGGRMRTSSISLPCSIGDCVKRSMPLAL